MMNEKMFREEGLWYRGNLHSHTVNSDGKLTPEQSAEYYREHGYAFMCFSEHDYYTDNRETLDREDFIVLPGLEASTYLVDSSALKEMVDEETLKKGYMDTTFQQIGDWRRNGVKMKVKKVHHIHGILGNQMMQQNAGEHVFSGNEIYPVRVYFDTWNGVEAAQKLSDQLKARGCFTTYNHPIWSRVDVEDVRDIKGIWGIECYNYDTVNECAEGEDTVFWDMMLRNGNFIMGFASDDNHNGGTFPDSCGGYVMVKAEHLDHESIVNGLLSGNYYASNGAVIEQWGVKNNEIYVECEAAERVNFIFGGSVGSSKTVMMDHGIPLKRVAVSLLGKEGYVRIEVKDIHGKTVWTNPVML